jgi:membrane protein implicated in regulation of membrane protease activity
MDLLNVFLAVFVLTVVLALVCWARRRRILRTRDRFEDRLEFQGYVVVLDESVQHEHQQHFQGNYYQFSSSNNSFSSQGLLLQSYPPSNYYGTLINNRRE